MVGKRKNFAQGSSLSKRRKNNPIEEITFDFAAREEYLTGFHKRKLQRIKNAREQAAKQDREERIRNRGKIREDRKADLEKHMEAIDKLMQEQEEFLGGKSRPEAREGTAEPDPEPLNYRDEFEDEDRFTTVTVEDVDVTRRGLKSSRGDHSDEAGSGEDNANGGKDNAAEQDETTNTEPKTKKKWWEKDRANGPKKKKKKFRYESKIDRKVTRLKERSSNKEKAKARRQ